MLRNTVSPDMIAEALGHVGLSNVDKYLTTDEKNLRKMHVADGGSMSMQELSSIEYKSKLAPYIRGLINEYKSNGYSFLQLAKALKNFDNFIIEKDLDSGNLDNAVTEAWSERRDTESLSTRNNRLSKVRILAKYMTSLGIKVSFPPAGAKTFPQAPYILSRDELSELFKAADEFDASARHYVPSSYGGIFRLYYHCGMRLDETEKYLKYSPDLRLDVTKLFEDYNSSLFTGVLP